MVIGIDCRLWEESGVGRYTQNLVKNFSLLRTPHEFVFFAQRRHVHQIQSIIGKRKWRIIAVKSKWHSLSEQALLPFILKRAKIDLMHFPYISVPLLYNRPFVITIHDLIPYHFVTGEATTLPPFVYRLKRIAYKTVLSSAIKKAKRIIAVSNATKEAIINNFSINQQKVSVIYEGVDSAIHTSSHLLSEEEKNAASFLKNTEYLLYIGNAYPHKNLKKLIEAFRLIGEEYPSLKLFLVGKDDHFYKRLRLFIQEMGLTKAVIHFGFVSDPFLYYLYKNAHALVAPSLMEGFGLSVLEAMANRCLVVCSDIPVFRELYLDTVLYCDPKKTQDIARVLKKTILLKTHERTVFVQKAHARTYHFSWETAAKETIDVYESCSLASSE